jgi:NAD(P)-dependent dehydrogenase (short-subunit alcohol dehydrogenase family)
MALAAGGAALAWAARRGVRRAGDDDLRGRLALVTGGARGLGLALARQLAARGARLVLVSRSADQLDRAAGELTVKGADAVARVCDVRDEAAVNALVAEVTTHLGPIDMLVNVAGVIESTPFVHATTEDFERSLATHFWGPLFFIRAALPSLRLQRGRIVNISSIGGRVAVPHLLPYCVGKFALSALSDGLRAELAPDGVSVLTVTPGLMRTGSYRNVTVRGQHAYEAAWFALGSITPLTAVKVERAAEQIVAAAAARRARLTVGGQARLAEIGNVLAPEAAAWITELAATLALPKPAQKNGNEARMSRDLDLGWFASLLPTALARRMNQPIAADERRSHHALA